LVDSEIAMIPTIPSNMEELGWTLAVREREGSMLHFTAKEIFVDRVSFSAIVR